MRLKATLGNNSNPLKGIAQSFLEARISRKSLSERVDREVRFPVREFAEVEGVTQSLNAVLEGRKFFLGRNP